MKFSKILCLGLAISALAASSTSLSAQDSGIRPPATPLITVDPYFSIWSCTDHPATDTTRHWTLKAHPIVGAVKVDGKAYRFLGESRKYPAVAGLRSRAVLPTRTVYSFCCGGVDLEVSFEAPLLMDDPMLFSRPVNYISWTAESTDSREHKVEVLIEASPRIAINKAVVPVTAEKGKFEGVEYVRTGTVEQPVLEKRGDDIRIDWGYFYLAVPKGEGKVALSNGKSKVTSQNFEKDRLMLTYTSGAKKTPAEGYVMAAYDDIYSLKYLKQPLRPYWNADGNNTIEAELARAAAGKEDVDGRCARFDERVLSDARAAGGAKYADLCALAYRQAMSAHKLVKGPSGKLYLISKENNSNGCAGTVDVTYPSIPVMLLYGNEFAKATVNFIFDYCQTKSWREGRKATWAPHDVGMYPDVYGQHYGDHMKLEECGNLLLLTAAICQADGNAEFAREHWEDLTLWTTFLVQNGQDPENTLCTDDFAGKLQHNANLSAKSILGVAAYAKMAENLGKAEEARAYMRKAKEMARIWKKMAADGDHYRLTFDKADTWSNKYNLVWDMILGLNVFDKDIVPTELKYYLTKQNEYGLPLDSRKSYTKTDWILWTAAMASDMDTFNKLVDPVWKFYNETTDRYPMGDWVNTETPTKIAMYCRSVVGGFYMKILADKVNAATK